MRFYALIPARGGSKRIPRKNLEKVGGVTLVERAIRCAYESRQMREIFVSTEDAEIGIVAQAAGALVVERPQYLASDGVSMDLVVSHFLDSSKLRSSGDDVIILLEPTAPLRTPQDITAIISVMRMTTAPAARTVSVDTTGKCHGWVYRDVGLASAIRVGSFDGCLFPEGTVLLHAGDDRAVDVDEPQDLERARALA